MDLRDDMICPEDVESIDRVCYLHRTFWPKLLDWQVVAVCFGCGATEVVGVTVPSSFHCCGCGRKTHHYPTAVGRRV